MFFYPLLRQGQKQDKKLEVQLFLVHLLVPMALAGRLHFCLVLAALALGLSIGLAISGAESIGGEVAIDFSKYSW